MATQNTLTRILQKVNDPAWRKIAYREVRKHFKGVSALCAATQSYLLISVGALQSWEPNCGGLTAHLKRNRWTKVLTYAELVPGCLCFMVDANGNKVSDHVVTFIKWLDEKQRVALVFDNHHLDPAPRNLAKFGIWHGIRYSRLAFWYALIPPN